MLSVYIVLLSVGSSLKSHSSPVLLSISLRRRPRNLLKALLLCVADEMCSGQCNLGTDTLGFPLCRMEITLSILEGAHGLVQTLVISRMLVLI